MHIQVLIITYIHILLNFLINYFIIQRNGINIGIIQRLNTISDCKLYKSLLLYNIFKFNLDILYYSTLQSKF